MKLNIVSIALSLIFLLISGCNTKRNYIGTPNKPVEKMRIWYAPDYRSVVKTDENGHVVIRIR